MLKKWADVKCEACLGTGQRSRINPEWLRAKRTAAGLSLRAMARHMGVSAAYVSDIERGRRNGNDAIVVAYGDL